MRFIAINLPWDECLMTEMGRCDQSLKLEEMIGPVPSVRKLIQDIDRTRFRVWALTNAYVYVSAPSPPPSRLFLNDIKLTYF